MEDTNNPADDGPLGAALNDYLSTRLDGQLGRAAAHFRRHLRGPASAAGTPARGPGGRPGPHPAHYNRLGGWVVGVVGSAVAASIAALWAGPALGPALWPPKPEQNLVPVAQYRFDLDEVTLNTQARDGGTVVLDNRRPARRIYRNEVRQSRWVDSEHDVSFETIEPRQDIMLIEMDTY